MPSIERVAEQIYASLTVDRREPPWAALADNRKQIYRRVARGVDALYAGEEDESGEAQNPHESGRNGCTGG